MKKDPRINPATLNAATRILAAQLALWDASDELELLLDGEFDNLRETLDHVACGCSAAEPVTDKEGEVLLTELLASAFVDNE